MKTLIKLFNDESGATAIEYGLIAALIAVAIIVGAGALGTAINNKFVAIGNELSMTNQTVRVIKLRKSSVLF